MLATHGIFAGKMQLSLLKDCQETIPTLVDWIYAEWRSYDKTLTKEKLAASFQERMNADKLPITLVALKEGKPIGVVSLKNHEDSSLEPLSHGNPWLGSLHVVPAERNQGIERGLLDAAKSLAAHFGHTSIFFYISNPALVDWYVQQGAKQLETRTFRNHPVSVMSIKS